VGAQAHARGAPRPGVTRSFPRLFTRRQGRHQEGSSRRCIASGPAGSVRPKRRRGAAGTPSATQHCRHICWEAVQGGVSPGAYASCCVARASYESEAYPNPNPAGGAQPGAAGRGPARADAALRAQPARDRESRAAAPLLRRDPAAAHAAHPADVGAARAAPRQRRTSALVEGRARARGRVCWGRRGAQAVLGAARGRRAFRRVHTLKHCTVGYVHALAAAGRVQLPRPPGGRTTIE